MLETCSLCNRDFLTEADPFVVRPTPNGRKLYCMCQIKGFDEMVNVEQELSKLRAQLDDKAKEIEQLKQKLEIAVEALRLCGKYQSMDTSGIANNALAKISAEKEQ